MQHTVKGLRYALEGHKVHLLLPFKLLLIPGQGEHCSSAGLNPLTLKVYISQHIILTVQLTLICTGGNYPPLTDDVVGIRI
jgi:hypothetical protein